MSQIPLNYQASAGDTNKQVRSTLPQEVVQCLDNARFLNLATCNNNVPHVSLMSYTYIPTSPYSTAPVIVMTTNPASKKVINIIANPIVSLLVHEWTYRRLPSERRPSHGSPGPEQRGPGTGTSSLVALLQNLNISSISAISAAINGTARLPESGSDEEAYYRRTHLENNAFDSETGGAAGFGDDGAVPQVNVGEDGGGRFVEGEEVRVIVVDIRDVRISDFKGEVRDWVLVPEGSGADEVSRVNGITGTA